MKREVEGEVKASDESEMPIRNGNKGIIGYNERGDVAFISPFMRTAESWCLQGRNKICLSTHPFIT